MESSNLEEIGYAKPNHINAIFEIEKRCFPGSIGYSKHELANLIYYKKNVCLIEKKGDVIRGFLIVNYYPRRLFAKIITVDVDPFFQNQGIGIRLMERAEDEMNQRGMRCLELEVSENNKAALALYNKAGYKFKEKIKGYYKIRQYGSCDAIRMIKVLSQN